MKGQSSPQDVACGVFVCRGAMRASLAGEVRLCDAVGRCCVTAVFAAIGGVAGVDFDPGAPSIFRFGAQNRDELAPASVTDTPVEPGLSPGSVVQILPGVVGVGHRFGPTQHVRDLQVLHHQQVVPLDEDAGLFVVEVFALVGDFAVTGRDRFTLAVTVPRSPIGPGQPLLRRDQPIRRHTAPAGILDTRRRR